MLIMDTLFDGTVDKVQMAIDRLKHFEPPEGYYLAYSGGKDSECILQLAKMAGVKYDAVYNWTTIDPPELFRHVQTKDVHIAHPEKSMYRLIREKRGLPTRQRRWCCAVLKERGGAGRFVMTGVRAAESQKRAGRKMTETCFKDGTKRYMNPIIDWTDEDVWEFIGNEGIKYCSLYDEGFTRLGCVGCPLGTKHGQAREFERWPKIAAAWKRAVEDAFNADLADGDEYLKKKGWTHWEQFWNWWITQGAHEGHPDQTVLFE